MGNWTLKEEVASIVLVGNLNPLIFQPEWFIRKEILPSWDYSQDKNLVVLPDLTRAKHSSGMLIQVVPEQFSIQTTLASNFVAIRDAVLSTFAILSETPLRQIGMNYTATVQMHDRSSWKRFSKRLAPQDFWEKSSDYLCEIELEKSNVFGLLDFTFQLPRPDAFDGFVRVKLSAADAENLVLTFLVNSHIDFAKLEDGALTTILSDHWISSLDLASDIIKRIMSYELDN